MDRIYLDNGATSWPKAPGVSEAMSTFIDTIGCNVGRGAYKEAFEAQRIIFETRERINELFNGPDPSNVIFTMNITMSLNMLLKGLLKTGDEVLVSSLEHNAVIRPLHKLGEQGIHYKQINCNEAGELDLDHLLSLLNSKTRAIVLTHASNVCGTIQPIEAVGKIAAEKGLFYILDCAQTAGLLPIDMLACHADAIAFTGHKALLGPQGIGGFVISNRLNQEMTTLIEGGTGSHSEYETQPEMLPDKFESGTPNTVGIYGLHAALGYIKQVGIDKMFDHEMALTMRFIEGISEVPNIRVVGLTGRENRTAVVSVDFFEQDNAEISYWLEKTYGISNRVGMHCAPSAHKALGTFPNGTVRFSFSSFNTQEQVTIAIEAVKAAAALG